MRHPPLFSDDTVKKAVDRISEHGIEDVQHFFETEPALQKYIGKATAAAMGMIYQGREPKDEKQEEARQKVAKAVALACSKTMIFTRACYSVAWEEVFDLVSPLPPGEAASAND